MIQDTDFGFLTPPPHLAGLLIFSFITDVKTRSGGMCVLAGGHRLIRRFVKGWPVEFLETMKKVRK